MQIDKTRVANMALGNLGEPTVQSLTQPGKAARAMSDRYDEARMEILCDVPWGFAKRFKVGVAVVVDPLPGFSYVFAYPNDALKVFYINHPDGTEAPPFSIHDRQDDTVGKLISTNESAPTFVYTTDKEDLTTWDWGAIIALSWLLASKGAMPITKSPKIEANAYQRYIMLRDNAVASTRTEDVGRPDIDRLGFYHAER